MKKLVLVALMLCVGVVAGCDKKPAGTGSGSSGAAPVSTGSAS